MSGYNVPVVTTEILGERHVDTSSFPPTVINPNPKRFYYAIRIITGSDPLSGTRNDLSIELVGSVGRTGSVTQRNVRFIRSTVANTKSYDDIVFECQGELGDVCVIVLGNIERRPTIAGTAVEKILNPLDLSDQVSAWLVDLVQYANLQTNDPQTLTFPCYNWIDSGDSISFTANTATVNDLNGNEILIYQRQSQIEQRRKVYQWQTNPELNLPSSIDGCVKDLPINEQFGAVKSIDFTRDAIRSVTQLGLNIVFGGAINGRSLFRYERLATAIATPTFTPLELSRWVSDEEFGRQMLNAVNPVIIERCSSIPANFPVTNDMVKGSLVRGVNLEDEMKAGHVYICDLTILKDLPCKEGWYCPAPMCLLYVNNNEKLVPIAIQLKPTPGSDNPIFLPSDNWADWTLAKICYQSANNQFHQLTTHYLSCHAAMEAHAVAVMRNLPDAHPVQKLLRPHFRYTMAINSRARETLINTDGIIDMIFAIGGDGKIQLLQRVGAKYNIHWTNIKQSVKRRGVDDPNLLPGYYYRDDGLKVWNAIEQFVSDIINEFYNSDDDVRNDTELQSWADDLHNNAFPQDYNKDGNGVPSKIENKAQLVELCTLIMFTGSAQHAAVNFGQYEIYGYVPNAPTTICSPLPTSKGKADLQAVLDALPNISNARIDGPVPLSAAPLEVAIIYILSQFSPNETFLGDYPQKRFTEEKAQNLIARFQKVLEGIDGDIKERNKSLDVPYVYLLPTRTPNSIAI